MPNTRRMTSLEMTRAVIRIEAAVSGVDAKLSKMPDWDDINRQEAIRDREQAKQDAAISSAESKITTLMFAVIGAALTAVAGVLRTL